MKKILKFFLPALAILALAACRAGNGEKEIPSSVHTHDYSTLVEEKASTCKDAGYKLYKCECGDTKKADLEKLSTHTWNSGVVTKDATCVEKGKKEYTCTVCGAKSEEVLSISSNHNLQHHDKTEATCTTEGNAEYYSCSLCNKNFNDEAATKVLDTIVINALGHTMTKHEAVAATCLDAGNIEYYSCASCNKNYSDEAGSVVLSTVAIAALGHTMTKHEAVAATCTETGNVEYYSCSACNKSFNDELGTTVLEAVVVEALGHKGVHVDGVAATADSTGKLEHYSCSVCGKNFSDEACTNELDTIVIPVIGHDLEYHKAVAATCTASGNVEYYHCKDCNKDFSDATCKNEITKTVVDALGHDMSKCDAVAATCTNTGNIEYYLCSKCNKKYSDEEGNNELAIVAIDALGHSLTYVQASPSLCTEGGIIAHYACSNCNKNYQDEACTIELALVNGEALGHNLSHHDRVEATCTLDGVIEYYSCSRCNNNYLDSEAKNLAESLVIASLGHTLQKVGKIDPSCNATGIKDHYKCTACNYLFEDAEAKKLLSDSDIVIPTINHSMSFVEGLDATCTSDGVLAHYRCSTCGYYYQDEAGAVKLDSLLAPKTGHNIVHQEYVDSTCTAEGINECYKCTKCNQYFEDADGETLATSLVIAKKAHELTHVDAVAATCLDAGNVEYYICSVCSNNYSDSEGKLLLNSIVVPALGHDVEHHSGKPATCLEGGYDGYNTCSRCDYSTYKYDEALGHNIENVEAKAAGCTTKGWDAYEKCTRCDYTTYNEIAKTGHNMEHVAKVEATCEEDGHYAYYHCLNCDNIYFNQDSNYVYTNYVIPATGHTEITHPSKSPTCEAVGWKAYVTCSKCDYSTKVEIPALGHEEVSHKAKAATCEEDGWKAYVTCERCTYTTYEEIPALGHNEVSHNGKAATCTEIGYKAYVTCSRCEYSTYAEITEFGHKMTKHEAVAATCLDAGNVEYYTCSRCNKSFNDNEGSTELTNVVLDATGHNPSYVAAKEATYDAAGNIEHYHCSNCGKNFSEEACTNEITSVVIVPKKHTLSYVDEIPATCLADGTIGYYHCTECNTNFTDDTCKTVVETYVINALGHDEESHDVQAATCTEVGWDSYISCSRCEYSTKVEIPALGHDMGAYISDNNATYMKDGTKTSSCSRCDYKDSITEENTKKRAPFIGKSYTYIIINYYSYIHITIHHNTSRSCNINGNTIYVNSNGDYIALNFTLLSDEGDVLVTKYTKKILLEGNEYRNYESGDYYYDFSDNNYYTFDKTNGSTHKTKMNMETGAIVEVGSNGKDLTIYYPESTKTATPIECNFNGETCYYVWTDNNGFFIKNYTDLYADTTLFYTNVWDADRSKLPKGASIDDAAYFITRNGVDLFGYANEEGKYQLMDGNWGLYTNDSGMTLRLSGYHKISYNGTIGYYSVVNGEIIANVKNRTYKITLDGDKFTSELVYSKVKLMDGKTEIDTFNAYLDHSYKLPNLKKEGYKFLGWYSDIELTDKVTNTSNFKTTKNVTLYAKWVKAVNITLHDIISVDEEKYSNAAVLIGNTYISAIPNYEVNTDYYYKHRTFLGWYLDGEFTIPLDESKVALESDSTIDIYAKWSDEYLNYSGRYVKLPTGYGTNIEVDCNSSYYTIGKDRSQNIITTATYEAYSVAEGIRISKVNYVFDEDTGFLYENNNVESKAIYFNIDAIESLRYTFSSTNKYLVIIEATYRDGRVRNIVIDHLKLYKDIKFDRDFSEINGVVYGRNTYYYYVISGYDFSAYALTDGFYTNGDETLYMKYYPEFNGKDCTCKTIAENIVQIEQKGKYYIATLSDDYTFTYKVKTVNLTLDCGGIQEDVVQEILGNTDVTITVPEIDGYEFIGWCKDSSYNNPSKDLEFNLDGDAKIYLYYKQVVTFVIHYNNGEADVNTTAYVGEGKTLKNPTKEGYMFNGWYTDSSLTKHWVSGSIVNDPTEVYAQYVDISGIVGDYTSARAQNYKAAFADTIISAVLNTTIGKDGSCPNFKQIVYADPSNNYYNFNMGQYGYLTGRYISELGIFILSGDYTDKYYEFNFKYDPNMFILCPGHDRNLKNEFAGVYLSSNYDANIIYFFQYKKSSTETILNAIINGDAYFNITVKDILGNTQAFEDLTETHNSTVYSGENELIKFYARKSLFKTTFDKFTGIYTWGEKSLVVYGDYYLTYDGGTYVYSISNDLVDVLISTLMVDENEQRHNFYLNIEKKTFTASRVESVKYFYGQGHAKDILIKCYYEDKITIPTPVMEDNYKFHCWCNNPDAYHNGHERYRGGEYYSYEISGVFYLHAYAPLNIKVVPGNGNADYVETKLLYYYDKYTPETPVGVDSTLYFNGWYIDEAMTKPFNGTVKEDMVIYASWTKAFVMAGTYYRVNEVYNNSNKTIDLTQQPTVTFTEGGYCFGGYFSADKYNITDERFVDDGRYYYFNKSIGIIWQNYRGNYASNDNNALIVFDSTMYTSVYMYRIYDQVNYKSQYFIDLTTVSGDIKHIIIYDSMVLTQNAWNDFETDVKNTSYKIFDNSNKLLATYDPTNKTFILPDED